MKKTDRAWLASLVNGEGCISAQLRGTVNIQISMCDVWCLHRALELVPGSHLGPWTSRKGYTAFRRWSASGITAMRLLRTMEPWLSPVKMGDWEFAMKRAPNAGKGNYAVRVLGKRTHCPKGHPFNKKNTYWYAGPHGRQRCCRACRLSDNHRWYARNKHTRFWMKYR